MPDDNRIQIYQSPDGETCVDVRFEQDTVRLTQARMVALFDRNVSVISRHIKNALPGRGNQRKKQFATKHNKNLTTYWDFNKKG